MDAYDCIITKRDVRTYSPRQVGDETRMRVLEAGRLSGSGKNSQHWRFILITEPTNLKRLAETSITGKWVDGANFAVVVLTDPNLSFHKVDAGRAAEDMQLAGWSQGLVSCIYTGIDRDAMSEEFNIPEGLSPTIVIGFGYPAEKVTGKRKRRKALEEIAFLETYGNSMSKELRH